MSEKFEEIIKISEKIKGKEKRWLTLLILKGENKEWCSKGKLIGLSKSTYSDLDMGELTHGNLKEYLPDFEEGGLIEIKKERGPGRPAEGSKKTKDNKQFKITRKGEVYLDYMKGVNNKLKGITNEKNESLLKSELDWLEEETEKLAKELKELDFQQDIIDDQSKFKNHVLRICKAINEDDLYYEARHSDFFNFLQNDILDTNIFKYKEDTTFSNLRSIIEVASKTYSKIWEKALQNIFRSIDISEKMFDLDLEKESFKLYPNEKLIVNSGELNHDSDLFRKIKDKFRLHEIKIKEKKEDIELINSKFLKKINEIHEDNLEIKIINKGNYDHIRYYLIGDKDIKYYVEADRDKEQKVNSKTYYKCKIFDKMFDKFRNKLHLKEMEENIFLLDTEEGQQFLVDVDDYEANITEVKFGKSFSKGIVERDFKEALEEKGVDDLEGQETLKKDDEMWKISVDKGKKYWIQRLPKKLKIYKTEGIENNKDIGPKIRERFEEKKIKLDDSARFSKEGHNYWIIENERKKYKVKFKDGNLDLEKNSLEWIEEENVKKLWGYLIKKTHYLDISFEERLNLLNLLLREYYNKYLGEIPRNKLNKLVIIFFDLANGYIFNDSLENTDHSFWLGDNRYVDKPRTARARQIKWGDLKSGNHSQPPIQKSSKTLLDESRNRYMLWRDKVILDSIKKNSDIAHVKYLLKNGLIYLFSLNFSDCGKYLKEGLIAPELIEILEVKGLNVSKNASLSCEENEWSVIERGNQSFIIKKNGKDLDIYEYFDCFIPDKSEDLKEDVKNLIQREVDKLLTKSPYRNVKPNLKPN